VCGLSTQTFWAGVGNRAGDDARQHGLKSIVPLRLSVGQAAWAKAHSYRYVLAWDRQHGLKLILRLLRWLLYFPAVVEFWFYVLLGLVGV